MRKTMLREEEMRVPVVSSQNLKEKGNQGTSPVKRGSIPLPYLCLKGSKKRDPTVAAPGSGASALVMKMVFRMIEWRERGMDHAQQRGCQ
jgi:hypothetical protein